MTPTENSSPTFIGLCPSHLEVEEFFSETLLKKPRYQKTTLEDFNLIGKPARTPVTFIRDGEVLWDEIKDLGFDESWLRRELLLHGISDYGVVFIAEWLEGVFVQVY